MITAEGIKSNLFLCFQHVHVNEHKVKGFRSSILLLVVATNTQITEGSELFSLW